MTGVAGTQQHLDGVEPDDRHGLVYLIAAGLAVLFVAMVVVAATTLTGADPAASAVSDREARIAKLPAYWTVRRGDSYEAIAARTGLTVAELERFNPYVNPAAIVPGQRLKLRLRAPRPAPKPKGPRTYVIRTGDTFGSIAARTGHSVAQLRRLNPKADVDALQPGARMRLRR